jgi:hypothetical protein
MPAPTQKERRAFEQADLHAFNVVLPNSNTRITKCQRVIAFYVAGYLCQFSITDGTSLAKRDMAGLRVQKSADG